MLKQEENFELENEDISLNLNEKNKLIEKLNKFSCIITIKDNIHYSGFFCRLSFPDEYFFLDVLIINSSQINLYGIKDNNNKVTLIMNDRNEKVFIEIDDSRIIYTSKGFNLSIIEIIEKKDNIKTFLEIDNNLNEEIKDIRNLNKLNKKYANEEIYILKFSEDNNIDISFGIFHVIENNYLYYYYNGKESFICSTIFILNKNFKIIGIQSDGSNSFSIYKGLLIKYFINDFYKDFTLYKVKDKKNEMTIIYNIDKNNPKINIFGEDFVKNNKDKCKMIIEGHKREIDTTLDTSKYLKDKDILSIKLIEYKTIHNMICLFADCSSLISLPDIDEWDMTNVKILRSIFFKCSSLTTLPDISKWNAKNVINMRGIFNGCTSLSSLPDISKWNVNNVNNICCLFCDCISLSSLPDISKWNVENVKKMNSLFYGCTSLKELPDISK